MITHLEELIAEAMKRHPDKGSVAQFKEEDIRRAWESWEISAKKIEPLLEDLYYERIEALNRAINVVIG